MKKTLRTRLITLALAAVSTFTVATTAVTPAYAADPSIITNIYQLKGEAKFRADNIQKALLEIAKTPYFKNILTPYLGPAVAVIDVFIAQPTTTLGDINKKLDDINEQIQGKIESQSQIAINAIVDAMNIQSCKDNLKELKASIKTAQNNIDSDLSTSSWSDEQKIREIAKELGNTPADWTNKSNAVHVVDVLGGDLRVNEGDLATDILTNSGDNAIKSMYRFQCVSSMFSGEAIDKSQNFVNTAYGIYLNSATTVLQYLYAKAQVATMDNDENTLLKTEKEINSILNDMEEVNKTYCEFNSLNRCVFVNKTQDANKHIPVSNALIRVNYKNSQVKDIDAVFGNSALTYDNIKDVINHAKNNNYKTFKEYLDNVGLDANLDNSVTNDKNNLITSKKEVTSFSGQGYADSFYSFKGLNMLDSSYSLNKIEYYNRTASWSTTHKYYDGNAYYFKKEPIHSYEITSWKNSCTFDGIEVEFTDKNTGEKVTAKSSIIKRIDDGSDPAHRTYTITVYLDGQEYTDTREVATPDYEIVSWKPNGDFSKATVNLRCTDCGKIATVEASELTRVDDNSEPMKRTYTVKVMIEEKEYTDTQEFQVKNYEFVDNGNNTVTLMLNWGNYTNRSIDWSKAGNKEDVVAVKINKGVTLIGDCSNMFNGLTNCVIIEAQNLVTDRVMEMNGMFCGCAALKELDLSNFETWFVNDMTGMFSGCNALETLDLANFDTTGCSYHIERMFESCTSLSKLTISDKMNVTVEMCLTGKADNFRGWANENDLRTIITGKDKIATFSGAGTYIQVAW